MSLNNDNLSLTATRSKRESSSMSSVVIRVILVLFCISVFAGCDTATGTKTPINISTLAKIDNLGVEVRVDKDFSVLLAGEELNGMDLFWVEMPFGEVVGEAVLQGNRHNEDAERAKNFRAMIAEINLQLLTQKALVDGLQSSLRFQSVTSVTEREEPPPTGAGILLVRIENWGLYAGSTDNAKLQKVQVGLNATASLVGDGGKIAWKHRDFFTSGVHRPIAEYISSPSLLKSEIEETARRYCARVVNEIRYAR